MTKTIYALGLLLCGTAAFAQPALPSPPSSPVPVLNFQYDAQGNLKTSTQVIGTGTGELGGDGRAGWAKAAVPQSSRARA